jgi:hypothetical protein
MSVFSYVAVRTSTDPGLQIHARLGEVLFMAGSTGDSSADKYLAEALRRFCRSIELCDDYLRGYYGLKMVCTSSNGSSYICPDKSQTSNKLLTTLPQASRQSKSDSGLPLPDIKTVERLNETATAKLSEIVRRNSSGESGWEGYDRAEVIAAKALLDSGAAKNIR